MTINPATGLAETTPLEFHPERYMGELDEFDLSEEQKVELLSALWQTMRMFVELGLSAELGGDVMRSAGLLPKTDPDSEEP